MTKQITNFPNALGWQGRERGFNMFNDCYDQINVEYTMFKYKEIKKFESEYSRLDSNEEYIYVCKGNLERLMNDLEIYNFNKNQLIEADSNVLKLKLIQTHFAKDFIRQPEKRIVEGEFYLLTNEQFHFIPFNTETITEKRNIFLSTKLYDSVKLTKKVERHILEHLTPLTINEELYYKMKYTPIIKEEVKNYVPNKVNPAAFQLAIKHDLTYLEFNFLNFFYQTNKAMRNGNGQTFYDIKHKGIGWSSDRKWVKKQMQRLIDLGLVSFEIRHDCRDSRYTSWYFYDSRYDLDRLTHDF